MSNSRHDLNGLTKSASAAVHVPVSSVSCRTSNRKSLIGSGQSSGLPRPHSPLSSFTGGSDLSFSLPPLPFSSQRSLCRVTLCGCWMKATPIVSCQEVAERKCKRAGGGAASFLSLASESRAAAHVCLGWIWKWTQKDTEFLRNPAIRSGRALERGPVTLAPQVRGRLSPWGSCAQRGRAIKSDDAHLSSKASMKQLFRGLSPSVLFWNGFSAIPEDNLTSRLHYS